jgi:hypothetical protein
MRPSVAPWEDAHKGPALSDDRGARNVLRCIYGISSGTVKIIIIRGTEMWEFTPRVMSVHPTFFRRIVLQSITLRS